MRAHWNGSLGVVALAAALLQTGCSGQQDEKRPNDLTPPTVPTGLQAHVVHPTNVTLTWISSTDAQAGVAGYHVYRDGVRLGSSIEPGYADTQALPGNHYQYAVSAYDGAPNVNESELSVPAEAATTYKITRLCPANEPGTDYYFDVEPDINNRDEVVGYFTMGYPHKDWERRTYLYRDGTWTDLSALLTGPSTYGERSTINDAGQVIISAGGILAQQRSALYSHGVMTPLGTLGGRWVRALDINQSGQIVGSSETADGRRHAFLYQDGAMTDLGTAGWTDSQAWAINDAGTVAGTLEPENQSYGFAFRAHVFRYGDGFMTDLGDCWPGDPPTTAYVALIELNRRGQLLCTARRWASVGPFEIHSYILDGDAEIGLDFPAQHINDAGQVIGHAGEMYDRGQTTSLGFDTSDINNQGQVVGAHTTAAGVRKMVLYASGRTWNMEDLIDAGDPARGVVQLEDAYRINDFGTVLARGYDESDDPAVGGYCRSFLLTLTGHDGDRQTASAPNRGTP